MAAVSRITDHGVSRIVGDLLTHDAKRGPDNLRSIDVSSSLEGARFVDALARRESVLAIMREG